MNEFTKEELQIIHIDMTIYVTRTPMLKESPSHKELRDKIQSMIENYNNDCKHMLTMTDTFTKCAECKTILGY